jgi:cation diffusion facilitator CzcD-associated flavoprotein CzcO
MTAYEAPAREPEHFDVVVVGAGLSGIGAACHLDAGPTRRTFVVFEARDASGGTWDLFRYPGVRSDSDMYTLSYPFAPWSEDRSIADGPSILRYVRDTARARGIDRHIRYHHRVVSASWSSAAARWTVTAERADTATKEVFTCRFLWGNTGYYRYDEGHAPSFAGASRFSGRIVHPQHWPDDLDCTGRRVAVIGSGATAVTLVPALAREAAHVTMVQRSPSYVLSVPTRDPSIDLARRLLPSHAAYSLVRWRNILMTLLIYVICRRWPSFARSVLRKGVASQLPTGYDVDRDFAPRYEPWDQRLCIVPDGDLFGAIAEGRASVATGEIDSLTETGLRLSTGEEIEADVVVTATGLQMLFLGGIRVDVDGRLVDLSSTVVYKGVMCSGVPNLAVTFGYVNASWTLKADLIAEWVCRLLDHMDGRGWVQCTPRAPDPVGPTEPYLGLTSGYVRRAMHSFPRQAARTPWRLHQNYLRDLRQFRFGDLDDAMDFAAQDGGPNNRSPASPSPGTMKPRSSSSGSTAAQATRTPG